MNYDNFEDEDDDCDTIAVRIARAFIICMAVTFVVVVFALTLVGFLSGA